VVGVVKESGGVRVALAMKNIGISDNSIKSVV
jgi:hypothetical protein